MSGHLRGLSRRSLIARSTTTAALATVAGWAAPTLAADAATPVVPRALGVIGSDAALAPQITAAGLDSVVVQVGWDAAQPAPGALDAAYVVSVQTRIKTYTRNGLKVILDPGTQYPPAWVQTIRNARFVDQYGNVFTADSASGENAVDAVWNSDVRSAQASYLKALATALGRSTFSAVRAGGLLTGELRLPYDVAAEDKAVGSWWGFSAGALAKTPAAGYRPGVSKASVTKDRAFLAWYLGSLADYQDFVVSTIAAAFDGDVHLLYPSFGVRPGDESEAVQAGLARSSTRYSELVQAVDYARLVARTKTYRSARPGRVFVVYSTWVDGPEFGSADQDSSPIAHLAKLAKATGASLGGENTADSATDLGQLALVQQRVKDLGLSTVLWFRDAEIFTGGSGIPGQLVRTFR